MSENSTFNYAGQSPSQSGQQYVRDSDQFKYELLKVGISAGAAKDIDQFLFNELSLANFNNTDREYILSMQKAGRMYLFASKTNKRSGRKYDLSINILRCYERARATAVTTKGLDGWGMLAALNPVITQKVHENIQSTEIKEPKKLGEGFFGQRKNDKGLVP